MSKILRMKISDNLINDLNAYCGLNVITELKAVAKEQIALWPEYEKLEIQMGKLSGEEWVIEKTLSPDEVDQLEKEINSITFEQRQKNLEECLRKNPAVFQIKKDEKDHGTV